MLAFFRRFSKDRFAKKIMRAVAAAGGPADFIYDHETFTLKRKDQVAFLGNAYDQYRQAERVRRQTVLNNYVATFAHLNIADDLSFAAVESQISAVVRERSFLATLDGPGWGLDRKVDGSAIPVHEPISAWFSRALVIDFPTHVMLVNQQHLKDWNLTFDEAFAIGLKKLRDCSLPKFRQEGSYYVGTWDDDYDSSRVLLPSIFDDLPLDGDPVVLLPNRVTLLVAGENDHSGIRTILAKAEQIVVERAKPQNPSPLVVRNGEVADFEVGQESPIFHEVQRAKKVAALSTYQGQKANLDSFYEKSGKDLFVASYTLQQKPSGEYSSQSVWSRGVATLLPETDFVAFYDDDLPEKEQIIGQVPWSRVVAVLGDLMLDTKMFPPRYYVSKFPTRSQLAELSQATGYP